MADLIIKPSSGNDLVIQGGDNSPAITVGNTGTTTFAENATLSGTANNLGTISSATTFPSGHVKNTWYHGCTSASAIAVSTSAWTSISTSANITITSGNKLVVWYGGAVMATSAKHWGWNIFIDGDEIGSTSWGTGITHGTTTYNGWHYFGSHTVYPITSTGTVSCELKLKVGTGTVTVVNDSNDAAALGDNTGWGYDGCHWVAQEIQA